MAGTCQIPLEGRILWLFIHKLKLNYVAVSRSWNQHHLGDVYLGFSLHFLLTIKSSTLRLEMCLLSGMIVEIKAKSITKSWRMTQLKIMNNLEHLISICRFPIGLWSDCYLVEISFIVGTQVSILYRTKRHLTMRSPYAWFLSVTSIFLSPSHLLATMFDMVVVDVSREGTMKQKRLWSSYYDHVILSFVVGTSVKYCIEQSCFESFSSAWGL